MTTKIKTDDHPVTQKEFVETKNEFRERFDRIERTMATKDDLERHAKMLIKHDADIEYIKNTMSTKDDIRKVLTAIDNFTGKNQDHEHKAIPNTLRLEVIEPKIENHEKRISSLESTMLK